MGNNKALFIEIFFRDGYNHVATIFNRSQSAYLKNMPEPRAWGAESPSSLPVTRNPRSRFRVTQANLALYLRSQIKSIMRELLLLKKYYKNLVFKWLLQKTSRIMIYSLSKSPAHAHKKSTRETQTIMNTDM